MCYWRDRPRALHVEAGVSVSVSEGVSVGVGVSGSVSRNVVVQDPW